MALALPIILNQNMINPIQKAGNLVLKFLTASMTSYPFERYISPPPHPTQYLLASSVPVFTKRLVGCTEREREMFYLTTHSIHFIYGYMASDIWLKTILIVRKETRCSHIGYSYRLTARVLLYAPSHRQDNAYHGLCYTSRGALAGTRNSSMGPPLEGSIRRPIAP